MPIETQNDPREVLTNKHFTLRPKPLEKWLWEQGVPQAAERVFWVHWEEGMRRRDWCSELPLKQVARQCCVDLSTVTRAYQVLKKLDLIRREDPGRDPNNPFQQAVAVTEVRVPRDLLVTLGRHPDRRPRPAVVSNTVGGARETAAPQPPSMPPAPRMGRTESKEVMSKLSAAERVEFHKASQERRTAMAFDAESKLDPEQRGKVLAILAQLASSVPQPSAIQPATQKPDVCLPRRKLSTLEVARVRRSVFETVSNSQALEIYRQVLWSVEEGALSRLAPALAINIALKKIREGVWTRPNRMPPNWMVSARHEACAAA